MNPRKMIATAGYGFAYMCWLRSNDSLFHVPSGGLCFKCAFLFAGMQDHVGAPS